jgi:hypothetical protein
MLHFRLTDIAEELVVSFDNSGATLDQAVRL